MPRQKLIPHQRGKAIELLENGFSIREVGQNKRSLTFVAGSFLEHGMF